MRVIATPPLIKFWEEYPDAEQPLRAWLDEMRNGAWARPPGIEARYGNATILKNRRVVFNIAGNKYRLIVAIAYRQGIVFVKFIGTHARYDQVDANTVELE